MNQIVDEGGLQTVLAPLSELDPCGPDVTDGDAYRLIRDARRADDLNLPQGIWDKAQKRADWALTESLCLDALCNVSKDLQIAAWLAEAWTHQRGMHGLADGLRLVDALAGLYWDQVHPRAQDGDIGYRTAPFEWIERNLPLAMQSVPLVAGLSPAGRALTLAEWHAVLRAERHSAQSAAAQATRKPAPAAPPELTTRVHFEAAAAQSQAGFFADLHEQIEQAALALQQLAATLDGHLGRDAPSLATLHTTLEGCYQAVLELGGTQGQAYDDDAHPIEAAESYDAPAAAPLRLHGIASREQAYRRLEEVADYLLRTEPHSPVPYLVKRAVSWGGMPLEELLEELLDNESGLKQIYRLLGTRAK